MALILAFMLIFSLVSCKLAEKEEAEPTAIPTEEPTPEPTKTVIYLDNSYNKHDEPQLLIGIENTYTVPSVTYSAKFRSVFREETNEDVYYAIELYIDTSYADFEYDGYYLYEITSSELYKEFEECALDYCMIAEGAEEYIDIIGKEKVAQFDEMLAKYDALVLARNNAPGIISEARPKLLDEQVELLREKGYEARRDGKYIRVLCNKQQMKDFPMDTDRFGYHFKFDDGLPD